MISAESFVSAVKKEGFSLWTGVPCSYLKPFINYVIDSPDLDYIGAANEGEAIAIAAGADLGGRKSIVMFQNSGLGNTVNPLTSINMIFKIPTLVITTWRGEPGGAHDEPQHELMGQITCELLDLMRIKWEFFPTQEDQIPSVVQRAVNHMETTKTPYALVMRKDSVAPYKLKAKAQPKAIPSFQYTMPQWPTTLPKRHEVLSVIQKHANSMDGIFATTGFMGRGLYALEDRENQLYMVGGMGCNSSFAFGFHLAQPNRRTIVLDGDGATLMRMGSLAVLGYERPKNFIHFILDNEVHDSTGGQTTVSHSVDFSAIAKSCGYQNVIQTSNLEDIAKILDAKTNELTLVHVKIATGEPDNLPRPSITPQQVAERMRAWAKKTS